jgi:formate hydrogenlyase transcriptional activator
MSPHTLAGAPSLLIVEDEFMIANGLRRTLEKGGYHVMSIAPTVAKAQALIAEHPPTIVLLDIFLQDDQTGIELAQWLSARDIPFVYLSANLTGPVLEAAKRTQPSGFLNKPFREKDVLNTLELALYRYTHAAEGKLRQQQGIQLAVNTAIATIQDRDQLCLAIATQLNKIAPFSLLNLRIGSPGENQFYWVMLLKNEAGEFERMLLPGSLRKAVLDDWRDHSPNAPRCPAQAGCFVGTAFEELCQQHLIIRTCRDELNMQAQAYFPVQLKQQSFTSIQLYTTSSEGLGAKACEAVELLMPQVALALDNLLASEQIERNHRLKAAESAVAQALQRATDIATTTQQVAAALNKLVALDLFSIYWLEPATSSALAAATVYKEGSVFGFLALDKLAAPAPADIAEWRQALLDLRALLQVPLLSVGERHTALQAQNVVAHHYLDCLNIKSALSVPVLSKGRVTAVLFAGNKTPYAYTEADLYIVQQLSEQLAFALENLVANGRIQQLREQLAQTGVLRTEDAPPSPAFEGIVGTSPALRRVLDSLSQVAPTSYTVLVLGETGTGKELIAKAVHNLSPRKNHALVKVNCAALPTQLIESELFGHEKGSYTGAIDQRIGKFELAHGGTIFLDEIGELPLELQAKLLRVLQEGEIERLGGRSTISVDVRIIAATNRDLKQEVAAGRFRSDLYYRLNVFPVVVPPLRERREDIQPLALHFLQKISKRLGKPITGLAHATLQQLRLYSWPGNIRELEHVLERAAILSRTSYLELQEPLVPTEAYSPAANEPAADDEQDPKAAQSLKDVMRETILTALVQARYRVRGKGGAAELLGIKPTTLEARIKKLHIGPTLPG